MRCCTASRACMFMLAVRMAAMFMRVGVALQHAVGDEHQPVAHLQWQRLHPVAASGLQSERAVSLQANLLDTARPAAAAAGDGRR